MTAIIFIIVLAWIATAISHTNKINDHSKAITKIQSEQVRQAEVIEKHEARIAKSEDQIKKLTFNAEQARNDIDNMAYKIEELQEYAKYLELERDACVPGGKEYFKWQNKVMQVDDKIYRLAKQMNKAKFVLAESQRKLDEVA